MAAPTKLLKQIKDCRICENALPHEPRPVVSFSKSSRVIIIGQAPGRKVHESGVPWDAPSGDRLRDWLQVSKADFYNNQLFAIVPMGFCYPGKGKSGDLPPRPECAKHWMQDVLNSMAEPELIILIGQYAQNYFLGEKQQKTLTETVKNFESYLPKYFVLPHPSPRNNIWMKKNPWFEKKVIPALNRQVKKLKI